jgi:asparaginyl-tRNA synthetase
MLWSYHESSFVLSLQYTYFQEKGFVYVNTPPLQESDAEGAGEMFKVTALPFDKTPRTEERKRKL